MKITFTATQKIENEVEISLPYFAKEGITYWAITGETENLTVDLYNTIGPVISVTRPARLLGANHEQITAAEFAAAYEKAQLAITESFLKACPKVDAPKVELTVKDVKRILSDIEARALSTAEGEE